MHCRATHTSKFLQKYHQLTTPVLACSLKSFREIEPLGTGQIRLAVLKFKWAVCLSKRTREVYSVFVQSAAVDLKVPVFWVCDELAKAAREVCFNIPSNVFQDLRAFYFSNVFHGSRRVSCVYRIRPSAKESVVMNYPSSRVTIFWCCAARNTPEIRSSKELSYHV